MNPKTFAVATATGMLLVLPGVARAGSPAVAVTDIAPIGKTASGTGDSAAPAIHARVVTVDTGNSIDTTGVGSGFQAQGLYVSVLYENGSQVTGPKACLPAGKVPFGDRVIGAWVPDGSTNRVLAPVTEVGQAYTGGQLSSWNHGTVSVRMVNLVKPPTLYANLQACGRVMSATAPSAPDSNLWSQSLSDVFSLPSTSPRTVPSITAAQTAPIDPLAPGLIVGSAPSTVPVVGRTQTIVKKVVQTVTQTATVTVPKPTQTVTGPVHTVTAPPVTVTTPPVTVSTPVVTVTAPTITVTVPGLVRRGG